MTDKDGNLTPATTNNTHKQKAALTAMSKTTYRLPFTDKEKIHQTDSLANCH